MLATEKLMRCVFGDDFRSKISAEQMDYFQKCQMVEKQQIKFAFNEGDINSDSYFDPKSGVSESEKFYISIYGEK